VLAGSFCRYLIDQYGLRRFQWLYRTGSFSSFYNKELSVLVDEWRRFIAQPEPTVQERTRAAFLFRRPSIFGKECARVIAGLNEETRRALREDRFEDAVALSARSLELSKTPDAVLQHATALSRAGRYDEVLAFGTAALADSTIAHTLLPLRLVLGDASWMRGSLRDAARWYETLSFVRLSPSYDEACGVRLAALGDRAERDLREIVLGQMPDSLRISWLESRLLAGRFSALVPYLLGRELIAQERWRDAINALSIIRPLTGSVLEFQRLRRLGLAHRETGEYQKAKMFYWESLNHTSSEFHRLETQELLRWCDWLEKDGEK
jgi:tetratricopeptide (TPR) repeat protein